MNKLKENTVSADYLDMVFDQVPNIMVILDEDLNVCEVNEAFLNCYNTTREKSIGVHFSEIFDTYSFINALSIFYKSTQTDTTINQNIILDRSLKHYKFHLKKLATDEKTILIFGEDQTKLFQVTQELESLQSKTTTISRLALVGELTSSVTQEIKHPLTIIMNKVGQIQRSLLISDIDRNDINKKLSHINDNIKRINRVTKNIELLALDSSEEPMKSAFVTELINNSLELCAEKLKTSEINLIIEDIDPNLVIDCKVNQFAQVVLNLISNTREALNATTYHNSPKWIKVSAFDAGEYIRFKFSDSSEVVSQKLREKLFENTASDSAEKFNPEGLGLTVTKNIVEEHYGKFFLESDNDHNAFIFDLPKGLSSGIT
jgi:C4-dicarboxylate-specific signal transduction histidine kinase